MNITKRAIEKLNFPSEKEGKTQALFYDDSIKGLGVRVTPTEKKTFFLEYKLHGKSKRVTLGAFPVLSVDHAKKLALQHLAKVTEGEDPATEKKERRVKKKTIQDLADAYYSDHVQRKNTEGIQKKYRAYLDQYVLKKFARQPVTGIDRALCKEMLAGMDHKPTTFNRVRTMINTMLNYGIDEEWITDNPMARIKPFKLESREKWIKPHELPLIYNEIVNYSNMYVSAYFRLLMYTACRRSELLNSLKWENIDFKEKVWTIPKTKNGTQHRVPLTQTAIDIIESLPHTVNPYVIAGEVTNKPYNGLDKAWERILNRAGVTGYTIHDIRRTMASYLAQEGIGTNRIKQVLNHKDNSVTGIYARLRDEDKRETLERLEVILRSLLLKSKLTQAMGDK